MHDKVLNITNLLGFQKNKKTMCFGKYLLTTYINLVNKSQGLLKICVRKVEETILSGSNLHLEFLASQ